MLRRQTRHVLFTEPSEPQAGQDMTFHYNPSNTCLSGCSDIFITVRTTSHHCCLRCSLDALLHAVLEGRTIRIVVLYHGMHGIYL